MAGFKSPLPILGYSRSPLGDAPGRSSGPLPFSVGFVTPSGVTPGRSSGPLPFTAGFVTPSGVTPGRSSGPLPFTAGFVDGTVVPPIVPDQGGGGGGYEAYGRVYGSEDDRGVKFILRARVDDNEIVEILSMIVQSGVLDQ